MKKKTQNNLGRFLSPDQCAQDLGVSRKSIYRAIERGELTANKGDRLIRIREAHWQKYLDERYPVPTGLRVVSDATQSENENE